MKKPKQNIMYRCEKCLGFTLNKFICEDCEDLMAKEPGLPPADPVDHPSHYNYAGIECIDAIKAALGSDGFKDYMMGNVLKYSWRYKYKNGLEDLKKARWYLDRTIKELEDEGT